MSQRQLFIKDAQYYKFCFYGFIKNLKLYKPFYMLFFLEKGMTFFQIGTFYFISEITVHLLNVPTGIIADSFGRRRTMLFSFSFYIFSFLLFFISNNYLTLVIAIMLFAFGDAFRQGTHKSMIFEYLKIKGWEDQKVHYYGHTRSYSQLGSALSALMGAAIVFYSGQYKTIFLYTMIPYVLDLLLILSYPKELDGTIKHLDRIEFWKKMKHIFIEFIQTFKKIKTIKGSVNLSIYSGFFGAVEDYLQPILRIYALTLPVVMYMNNRQREAIIIAVVYFVLYLFTSYLSRHSGRIAARFSNLGKALNSTLWVGFVMGLLSGLFYILGFLWLSIVLYFCIHLFENLRKPMAVAYVADLFDQKILATALSGASQLDSLFTAIMALILGFLTDRFGIGYSLMIVSFLCICSIPLYSIKNQKK